MKNNHLMIDSLPLHKTTFRMAYSLLSQIIQRADVHKVDQEGAVFNVECDRQLFENLCSFDAEIADWEDDFDMEDGHDREMECYL